MGNGHQQPERNLMSKSYIPASNELNHSQHGEQPIILQYFQEHVPTHKILVDVGALGRMFSNSWALLTRGWHGILIDADPASYEVIKFEFSQQDVEVICVGVGDCECEMDFHLHSATGHNSFLPDWYPQTSMGQAIKQKVRPLADILAERKIPFDFDFLTIDTEGMDERIMRKFFAESEYRPHLVVTECTSYANPNQLFGEYGYRFLTKTGNPEYGNLIYAR